MTTRLTIEQALVWRCCRSVIASTKDSPLPTAIGTILHWDALLNYARWHGVTPLLNQALTPHKAAMPPRVVEELTVAYVNALKQNLFLTSELLKLLELFESHDIQAIPFKGIMLSACVYGNMAFHRASDLDILVHREDIPRIKTLLVSAGYRPDHALTEAQERALLRRQGAYHFTRSDGLCRLDLHWQMVAYFFAFLLPAETAWADRRTAVVSGHSVPTLPPEQWIILLCVHGAAHRWDLLSLICDLARMLTTCGEMDWKRLLDQAERQGIKRMVLLGLLLAERGMEVPLPQAVQTALRADSQVERLAQTAMQWLTEESRFRFQRIRALMFHIRILERPRDKLRYLYRILTTTNPEDWKCLSLPRGWFALYMVIRPLRMGWAWWIQQWKHHSFHGSPL